MDWGAPRATLGDKQEVRLMGRESRATAPSEPNSKATPAAKDNNFNCNRNRNCNRNESNQLIARWRQISRTMLSEPRLGLLFLMSSLVMIGAGAPRVALASTMSLPDGIENILGFVPSSNFRCERDGYFGDIDNDCRIFHLCQKQISSNGRVEWRHWTYACGNQTMFNQLTLTCAFVDEAIPCRHASQFQYLNEVIHKPREPFLTDADVTSGISYYTNRVMSDGARNRAFEDSTLMAQLGGGGGGGVSRSPTSSGLQFAGWSESDQATSSNFNQLSANFQGQNSNLNLNFQRPPQQQQQQLGLFLGPSSAAGQLGATESDEAPSRASANSLELVDPPLGAAFQSLSRQASAPVAAAADRQTAVDQQQGSLVLVNHHQAMAGRQPLQLLAFPTSGFGALPPTTEQVPAARQADAPEQVALQASRAQQQPASFNFAVATDHRLGASDSSSLFTSSQASFAPQQQQQTTLPSAQFPATQNPRLPTPAPTTAASFTATPPVVAPAATAATSSSDPSAAAATATTTTAEPTTSAGSRRAEPEQATTTAESTSTPPAATTTTTAASRPRTGAISGQTQRRATGRVAASGRRAAAAAAASRAAGEALLDAHPMRHFQSNRLSAMKQQQQRPATAESAIVMRRQAPPATTATTTATTTTTTTTTSTTTTAPAASAQASSIHISAVDESEAFWRRPFDMQLMAPRFESLLTRRRV